MGDTRDGLLNMSSYQREFLHHIHGMPVQALNAEEHALHNVLGQRYNTELLINLRTYSLLESHTLRRYRTQDYNPRYTH